MAGRTRSPSTEIDLELKSPATKKTKLSEPNEPSRIVAATTTIPPVQHHPLDETAPSILRTPYASDIYLETSEVLSSTDDLFCDEGIKKSVDKQTVPAEPSSSSSTASCASTRQKQPNQQSQDIMGGDVGQIAFSLKGEHGGPYRDLVQIGDGAYGTVYKARDVNTNQNVAMKRIRMTVTEDGLPTSTLREIAALKHINRFEHPHIVRTAFKYLYLQSKNQL